MELIFVNKTDQEINESFLDDWICGVKAELAEMGVLIPEAVEELVLVFVDEQGIRDLNLEFRNKDKPTDVLSFAPVEESCLGELIFCSQVITENAKDHKLSFEAELGYMCLHGILHLLGYEHETNEEEAKEMFRIQDSVFEKLSAQYFPN